MRKPGPEKAKSFRHHGAVAGTTTLRCTSGSDARAGALRQAAWVDSISGSGIGCSFGYITGRRLSIANVARVTKLSLDSKSALPSILKDHAAQTQQTSRRRSARRASVVP